MYFDVLKEIGNIGAGNATTAIASMLGLRLDMDVPQVRLLTFQELPSAISGEEDAIVGIYLEVQHDISGSMMFIMDLGSAHYLVNKMMMRDVDYNEEFSEMDLSALMEVGNIIAGSYLNALSSLTNLTITPSVPYICIDMAGAILSVPAIQFGQYGDNALLIETSFGDEVQLNGYFILLPDIDSYDKILSSLGISLE
ncbi:MAG: chemotaxis protein CheC [Eubacterium sp.]|nr:chemotaxis protein CheC [Eubacterium sp.]